MSIEKVCFFGSAMGFMEMEIVLWRLYSSNSFQILPILSLNSEASASLASS